uniref:Uncharacterized protein n=1 Tax=Opuntia streptacantha TaxID=393608 RepID=A0A7C9A289_OPUST
MLYSNLYGSSFHLFVHSLTWPQANYSIHSNDILQPQVIHHRMSIREFIRKGCNLNNASMISKVNKSKPTMDPVKGDPPTKPDPLTHIRLPQLATEGGPANPLKRVLVRHRML